MSRLGAPTIVPEYSVADAPAAPGSLAQFAGLGGRDALQASVATGSAQPNAASVYEAYYGPAPAGVQNVDVMGHIARTNLTLPAYYQVISCLLLLFSWFSF